MLICTKIRFFPNLKKKSKNYKNPNPKFDEDNFKIKLYLKFFIISNTKNRNVAFQRRVDFYVKDR